MQIFCKFLLSLITIFVSFIVDAKASNIDLESVFLKADIVKYDDNFKGIKATGNVVVMADNYMLAADSLYYDFNKDIVFAEGNIRIKDDLGKIILARQAILQENLKKAVINELILKLPDGSLLIAAEAKRYDKNKINLYKSRFTPCKVTCKSEPIWQIRAQNTNIDYDEEIIKHNNVFFEVFGLPILYLPYFSHPTPNASAQSGLLIPGIRNDTVVLPIYFRAKSNFDFTISPRLAKNYTIIEAEIRHLLKEGSYKIDLSTGDPYDGESNQDKYLNRYYIFAKGDFYKNDIRYGFDFNRTSDDSYLKNYYNIYHSYLESKIYLNKVNVTNYASVEVYSFQDLRAVNINQNSPIIFPKFTTQNIIMLNDDETVNLKINNNFLGYNEKSHRQLIRNAFDLALNTHFITDGGHFLNASLANRIDFYLLKKDDDLTNAKKGFDSRSIPELHAEWRYPLIRNFHDLWIKIEPIISGTIGMDYNKKFDKFAIIDIAKYELSEHNIFNANRFNGIDYHDYGRRLSYGINTSFFKSDYYLNFFIGQLLYKNNIPPNSGEYVGNLLLDMNQNAQLYYRFRKTNSFNSILNEFGLSNKFDKLDTDVSFSKLSNIPRYFAAEKPINVDSIDLQQNISQLNLNIGYQLFDSLKINGKFRFDLTNKFDILQKTIIVTYSMDCVNMAVTFSDSSISDQKRGIRALHGYSLAVGLKILNM